MTDVVDLKSVRAEREHKDGLAWADEIEAAQDRLREAMQHLQNIDPDEATRASLEYVAKWLPERCALRAVLEAEAFEYGMQNPLPARATEEGA